MTNHSHSHSINTMRADCERRSRRAEWAGEVIHQSVSETSAPSAYGTLYTQIGSESAAGHQVMLPEDRTVCCGVMFPVRRTFCLLVTFDLIMTFIVWVSYMRILGGETFSGVFDRDVLHYTFESSLFDTVMCAAWRFVLLLLAYALFRLNHPWVVAVTTLATCIYLLAKVFLFEPHDGHNDIICYAILLLSFTTAWIETWFLDFKVLPWEHKVRSKCGATCPPVSERASLLHSGSHCQFDHGPQFYSPIDSGSEDGDSLHHEFMSVPTSRRLSVAEEPADNEGDDDEMAGYRLLASEVWRRGWEILQIGEGWKREAGTDEADGIVYSRHVARQGKVFRLEAILDATPQVIFEDLVLNANETPSWNATVMECKTLALIDDATDIAYNVAAAAVGGLISSRDFVSIRHWRTQDGVIFAASSAVTFPSMPPVKQHVRAVNRPGGIAFSVSQDDPNKCHFCWILNTDIKGWVPQYAIDQALSGTLLEFLKHLRARVARITARPTGGATSVSSSDSTPTGCGAVDVE